MSTQTPMRLFALKTLHNNKVLPAPYFATKPEARVQRDRMNAEQPGAVCVTPGPDHRRFVA